MVRCVWALSAPLYLCAELPPCPSCAAPVAYLLVDEGRDWQAVEAVCERSPETDVVPPLALVIEAVDAIDGRALVVAAQQEEVLGVLDLRETTACREGGAEMCACCLRNIEVCARRTGRVALPAWLSLLSLLMLVSRGVPVLLGR